MATQFATSETGHAVARRSTTRWHWWGTAAGVLGLVANIVTDPAASVEIEQRKGGDAVIDLVTRGGYHLGAVAGIAAVGCLLVLAAGYRRWAEQNGGSSLALRTLPAAIGASAAALIVGYGFKGMLAIYLPGGINQNTYPAEGLYSLFMVNDLAGFFGWWGVAFAAGCLAWLGLREAMVPRWIGVFSALAFLAPVAFIAGTGLTGFPGVICPLWLAIVSAGQALRRSSD